MSEQIHHTNNNVQGFTKVNNSNTLRLTNECKNMMLAVISQAFKQAQQKICTSKGDKYHSKKI